MLGQLRKTERGRKKQRECWTRRKRERERERERERYLSYVGYCSKEKKKDCKTVYTYLCMIEKEKREGCKNSQVYYFTTLACQHEEEFSSRLENGTKQNK